MWDDLALSGKGWSLRVARPEDGPGLCALFRDVHVKGTLDVAQERDPDFFALLGMHTADARAIVAHDDGGRVIGCGTVVVRDGWLDGQRVKTGYLGDLRVRDGSRQAFALARAYGEVMRHVREATGADTFTTVIFDSNALARRALVDRKRRGSMPVYQALAPFDMVSVQFTRARKAPDGAVGRGTEADLPALEAFLARRGQGRVLGEDFTGGLLRRRLATWPGFAIGDFYLAKRGGRLVGCTAPWDTSAFKRTRVLGYHREMRLVKGGFGLAARVMGWTPLPEAGDCFRFEFLTHLEVEDDDPAVLRDLLRAVYADRRDRGLHFVAGLSPRGSRLDEAFREFSVQRTAMTLYVVHPADGRYAGCSWATTHSGFEMALS